MCVVLIGSGHLHCMYVLEVLRPITTGGAPIRSFEQHYDFVLRNCGSEPIRELLLIHQRGLHPRPALRGGESGSGVIECEAIDQSADLGDLPFRRRPFAGKGRVTLELRAAAAEQSGSLDNEYQTLSCTPVTIENKEYAFGSLGVKDRRAIFEAESPLPAPVRLTLAEPLLQYDETFRTQYLLRLHFPEIAAIAVCSEPFSLGASSREGGNVLLRQTFETLAPEFLCQRTIHGFKKIADAESPWQGASPEARGYAKDLLDEWLLNPDRTVHIDDHRIALVTADKCMLLDSHVRGGMTFWQRRRAERETGSGVESLDRWLNIWTWGSAWNPRFDPAHVACELLTVLERFPASDPADGHRAEILLPVVGSSVGLANLVQVLDVLKTLGLVACDARHFRWRLADGYMGLPEKDSLRLRIRTELVRVQKSRGGIARKFDEHPFILTLGIGTVAS